MKTEAVIEQDVKMNIRLIKDNELSHVSMEFGKGIIPRELLLSHQLDEDCQSALQTLWLCITPNQFCGACRSSCPGLMETQQRTWTLRSRQSRLPPLLVRCRPSCPCCYPDLLVKAQGLCFDETEAQV